MYQENEISNIVTSILQDYQQNRVIDKLELSNMPEKDQILDVLKKLIEITYYGFYRDSTYKVYDAKTSLKIVIEDAMYRLTKQVSMVLPYSQQYASYSGHQLRAEAGVLVNRFFKTIPYIRGLLNTDLQAILEGDPAASNMDEIILSYPGFYAITVHRIAHQLFLLNIPMIPRILSEHAHSLTGIDIHPGATIDEYFCIDHGTGIVIGETTIIGKHVKLYQGVTLGALSTRGGQSLKGKKRHPSLKDNVTVYANASVLGDITVGSNCTIGGNVFITRNIDDNTTVSVASQELHYRTRNEEIVPDYNI